MPALITTHINIFTPKQNFVTFPRINFSLWLFLLVFLHKMFQELFVTREKQRKLIKNLFIRENFFPENAGLSVYRVDRDRASITQNIRTDHMLCRREIPGKPAAAKT